MSEPTTLRAQLWAQQLKAKHEAAPIRSVYAAYTKAEEPKITHVVVSVSVDAAIQELRTFHARYRDLAVFAGVFAEIDKLEAKLERLEGAAAHKERKP